MVSIKEIREKSQQREKIAEDFYEARLLRRISPYFTKFFIEMGISANNVTIISMMVVGSASFLFLFFDRFLLLSWFLYFFVYNLLDDVDGEVARTTGTQSILGNKLETATHVLLSGSFLFFAGIGYYFRIQNNLLIIASVFYLVFSWILYDQVLEIDAALSKAGLNPETLREVNSDRYPIPSWLWNKYQNIKGYFELNRAGFLLFILLQEWFPSIINNQLEPLFLYYIYRGLDLIAEVIVNKVRLSSVTA